MSAVLELENRFIRYTYYLILLFTLMVNGETLRNDESLSFSILLIGSTIGFGLFWFIEFSTRQVFFSKNLELTRHLLGIILLGRCVVFGTLTCFLLYFLLSLDSRDVIPALITWAVICVTGFIYNWLRERTGVIKELEIYHLASSGLIIFLAFCIGYFAGKWIGGYFGNAAIGSYIGLGPGFVVTLVQGGRMEKQRRTAAKNARAAKKENLLKHNTDFRKLDKGVTYLKWVPHLNLVTALSDKYIS